MHATALNLSSASWPIQPKIYHGGINVYLQLRQNILHIHHPLDIVAGDRPVRLVSIAASQSTTRDGGVTCNPVTMLLLLLPAGAVTHPHGGADCPPARCQALNIIRHDGLYQTPRGRPVVAPRNAGQTDRQPAHCRTHLCVVVIAMDSNASPAAACTANTATKYSMTK